MAPIERGTTPWHMEYSVHRVPPAFKAEVLSIFPKCDLEKLLIVPTCQRSVLDLVNTGEPVEQEKDRCLERFMAWAKVVCDSLLGSGHWADYIDPCSGLPV
ncbi:Methylmalonic aciduria and homocystinuria type D, mitochondrial, partial [Tetrabaena socialis]